MSLRKLLPVAMLLAAVSIRCAGSPAEPIGTVSVTQTTTTTTTSIIPGVEAGVNVLPGLSGVAAATVMTFSTVPSGGVPPYTVNWIFGDGQAGAGLAAPHIYAQPGIFVATANVSDSGGRTAQAFATVTIPNVTGTWNAHFESGTTRPADEKIDLVQSGGDVAASSNDTLNSFAVGSGAGTVANPRALTVKLSCPKALAGPPAVGTAPFAATLIGAVDANVTVWNGTATGYPGCPCDFNATRSSIPGVLSAPAKR